MKGNVVKGNVVKGIFTGLFLILMSASIFAQSMVVSYRERRPVIQLALLLDTSNSMDGLINQAKSQL